MGPSPMLDQSPTDDAGAVAYRRKSGYRPHRLVAQDTALSRRRHGFESRWGHASRNSVVVERSRCMATAGPVVKPGVHAALSRRRSRVRIPSGPQHARARAVARPGSSVGMSARLKSGRSTVRSCPWPPSDPPRRPSRRLKELRAISAKIRADLLHSGLVGTWALRRWIAQCRRFLTEAGLLLTQAGPVAQNT
jgi:hypothetical protein